MSTQAPPARPGVAFEILSEALPKPGMTCVAIVRDELWFMPAFLGHYRELGIAHFVFCDDGSSDGTREFLMGQNDCTVVGTAHGFQEMMADGRPFHYVVRTALADRFCPGEWYLHVDADEFLYLPARFVSLSELVDHLEERGELCAAAAMVDLYPATLARRNVDPERGPGDRRGLWFDRTPGFARNPYDGAFEARMGGIRARLVTMLAERHPALMDDLYPRGIVIAKLWKVPLRKSAPYIQQTDSHALTVSPPEDIQLGLAHYRFYPGLDAKVADATSRLNHWNASQEYKFLSAAIRHLEEVELVGDESVAFDGESSLEAAGLMFAKDPLAIAAGPRVQQVFGAPVLIERLGDVDVLHDLEGAILSARRKALEFGHPGHAPWQANLADPRFHSEALQSVIDAAARAARTSQNLTAQNLIGAPDPAARWSATAKALVLPSGGPGVRVEGQGRWIAAVVLRADAGSGGLLSLTDLRHGKAVDGAPLPETPVAASLMLLAPAWCALTFAPWQGPVDALRIVLVLELSLSQGAAGP